MIWNILHNNNNYFRLVFVSYSYSHYSLSSPPTVPVSLAHRAYLYAVSSGGFVTPPRLHRAGHQSGSLPDLPDLHRHKGHSFVASPSARPFASVSFNARHLQVQAGRRRGKVQRNHRVCVSSQSSASLRSHSFIPTPPVTNLGLHSAAASGDYGLVRYALANGQPINSVLHGVLPIHVACSGGDEQVVNLLIDNGADVNAPRYVPSSFSSGIPSHYLSPSFNLASQFANFHIYVQPYQDCPYDTPVTRTGTLPRRSSEHPVPHRFISLAQTVTSIL